MDQYIGKLLDNRYELLERIGIGGMAVVYKGRDHRLNRLVAVKILKEELAQDAEFRRRFHDESQAVAMLSHPNIVAVYDVSHSDELDYIVMELIDGITLKQYMLKRGGKLSWREALHFITQIMKGLSHAHSRGIIHRDIKPHNIMVLRDGSIKVADFGIARLTSTAQFGIARLTSTAQSTLTQEALGSVHYISPEQARGSHIDARSDIYSAGVVLYEMITGRLPYEGDSPVAVAIQHINSVPLSPREIDPEIPEALEAITMKAMASDVNRRYISADAMLADLEEFRKNPSINFDYTTEDLFLQEGDEPTQILGANAPSSVYSRTAHPREGGGQPQRRPVPEEYEDAYEPTPRRGASRVNWSVVTAVGVILLFLIGVGVVLWLTLFSNILGGDQTYPVPYVLDMTLEEARRKAQEEGFTIQEGGEVPSDLPEGQIVSQSPDANTQVPAGERVITVTVSGGPEETPQMLTVTGQKIEDAQRMLNDLNLNLDIQIVPKADDDVEEDRVIEQEPAEGTELAQGQTVTLTVSTGPEETMVVVPRFIGQDINYVMSNMIGTDENQYNLNVTLKEEYSESVPANEVTKQTINPWTQVAEGTAITLTYSLGPDPSAQPSPTPSLTPPPVESSTPSTAPSLGSRRIDIALPQDDRATVKVTIMVGDDMVMNEQVFDTSLGTISPTITGSGTQQVIVYIDGSIASEEMVDFT